MNFDEEKNAYDRICTALNRAAKKGVFDLAESREVIISLEVLAKLLNGGIDMLLAKITQPLATAEGQSEQSAEQEIIPGTNHRVAKQK